MIWLLAGAVFWVICGVLAYGFVFAYFQHLDPEECRADFCLAASYGMVGPFGLIAVWGMGFTKHGLKFW